MSDKEIEKKKPLKVERRKFEDQTGKGEIYIERYFFPFNIIIIDHDTKLTTATYNDYDSYNYQKRNEKARSEKCCKEKKKINNI